MCLRSPKVLLFNDDWQTLFTSASLILSKGECYETKFNKNGIVIKTPLSIMATDFIYYQMQLGAK